MTNILLGNCKFTVNVQRDANSHHIGIEVEPVSNDGSGVQIGPTTLQVELAKYEPGEPVRLQEVTMVELPIYLKDFTDGTSTT